MQIASDIRRSLVRQKTEYVSAETLSGKLSQKLTPTALAELEKRAANTTQYSLIDLSTGPMSAPMAETPLELLSLTRTATFPVINLSSSTSIPPDRLARMSEIEMRAELCSTVAEPVINWHVSEDMNIRFLAKVAVKTGFESPEWIAARDEFKSVFDEMKQSNLSEEQKEGLLKRLGSSARHAFLAVLDCNIVGAGGRSIDYVLDTKVGATVWFIAKNIGMTWLSGTLGSPLGAAITVNLGVTILRSVPKYIRDAKTHSLKQVGVDILGVAVQLGSGELGKYLGTMATSGLASQVLGGVIGSMVGNRFQGILVGTAKAPIAKAVPRQSPDIPQPPPGLTDAEQLKWYNTHKKTLYGSIGVAAMGAVLTAAMLSNGSGAAAALQLWSVNANRALELTQKISRKAWLATRHSEYAQSLGKATLTAGFAIPAGALARSIRAKYDSAIHRLGLDQSTQTLLPKSVVDSIKNKAVRDALYEVNVAWLSSIMGEILETTATVSGSIAASSAAASAVETASHWTSLEDARASMTEAYNVAYKQAQDTIRSVVEEGEAFDPTGTLKDICDNLNAPSESAKADMKSARDSARAKLLAQRDAAREKRFKDSEAEAQAKASADRQAARADAQAKQNAFKASAAADAQLHSESVAQSLIARKAAFTKIDHSKVAEAAHAASDVQAKADAAANRLAARQDARATVDARKAAEAAHAASDVQAKSDAAANRLAARQDARATVDARKAAEAAHQASAEQAHADAEANRLAARANARATVDARKTAEAAHKASAEQAHADAEANRLAARANARATVDARKAAEAAHAASDVQAKTDAAANRLAARADLHAKAAAFADERQKTHDAAISARDSRLADRLAARQATSEIDDVATAAQIKESAAWLTQETAEAWKAFQDSNTGKVASVLEDTFGSNMKALGYTGAKLAAGAVSGSVIVNVASLVTEISSGIGYAELATTSAAVVYDDNEFIKRLDTELHRNGEPARQGLNRVLGAIDDVEKNAFGVGNVAYTMFNAFGWNPAAQGIADRTKAWTTLAVGEKITGAAFKASSKK